MHSHSWHWQLKEGITIDGKDIYRFIIALLFIFPVRSYINHLVIEPQINSTFPFDAELESWLYFQNHLIIIGGVLLLLGWFTRIIALLIGLFTVLHLLLIEIFQFQGLIDNHIGINILLFSALVLLAILGPGKYSIDHFWHKLSNS
ncbi:MAG TPA: hypothetical protein DDY13_10020 [Cytophagales bacterium]|mgnify:CR=1 FL=1|jgi:uncharacterized membrane protein YphA (DoxX/SURF4 family)|nr:hypothetical protein [Cytophagales bacterium]